MRPCQSELHPFGTAIVFIIIIKFIISFVNNRSRKISCVNVVPKYKKGTDFLYSVKHHTKHKERYSELNRDYADRIQRGFRMASAEILQMFEDRSPVEENSIQLATA